MLIKVGNMKILRQSIRDRDQEGLAITFHLVEKIRIVISAW